VGKILLGIPRRRCVDYIRMRLWGESASGVFVGKQEAKRHLGRPRLRWVDNIKMYLRGEGIV
jgi:hypothetical protein